MAEQVVTKKPKISGYVCKSVKQRFEKELSQSDASSASNFLETFLESHLGKLAISLDEQSLKTLQALADKNMRSIEQQATFLLTQILGDESK